MSRSIRLMSVVMLIVSVPAVAGDKPRLVLVPLGSGDGASETATQKFSAILLEELKSRGDTFDVVSPPAVKASSSSTVAPVTGGKRGPSTDAVAAIDAGRKAFDDLRFDDASASLKKGIDGLLADPASADFEVVTDAYVKLAASAFRLGEERDAKQALLDLVRIAPSYQLPAGFPPVFQREFEKARKRLDKQPRGQISVEGPAGATAYVDGRDLGMVPVVDENVPAGLHYVKVEGGKGERFGQAVELKGSSVKVKAAFGSGGAALGERAVVKSGDAPVELPRVGSSFDDATKQKVVAFARASNADIALVGYVYKTADTQLTLGAALFGVKKGSLVALTAISFDTDVMTANTEAFKLADELVKRLSNAGPLSSLPLNLMTKAKAVVAKVDRPTSGDEVDVSSPNGTRVGKKTVVLTPKEDRALENKTTVVELEKKDGDGTPPPTDPTMKKPEGVPTWVWVVVGVGVAAGAGVGVGFGVAAATKPVTGTVNATW
jgi:environmental stress-induced protein Ves/anti-sigma factor RsiW